MRREFFYATPAEVKEHLIAIRDAHVLQYTDTPEAVEWRASEPGRRGARDVAVPAAAPALPAMALHGDGDLSDDGGE